MIEVDKLKELTDKLPPIPKLTDLVLMQHSDIVEYNVEDGFSTGKALASKKEVGVMDLVISKGTTFPTHVHEEELEYVIIYKGSMEVDVDGHKETYKAGDCISFNKGSIHGTKALELTAAISVSIPKINGYPQK